MYVFFRFFMIWLKSLRAPRQEPDALIVTRLRVYPSDLDINLHLNNGRYLTLMDLGRFDLCMKTGLLALMRRHRWYPVLASAGIRFRRELGVLDSFELQTRIVYWDEKWFYILQEFVKDGDVHARGLVKGVFRSKEGTVPVRRIMEALGVERPDPERPEVVAGWAQVEKELR